MAFRWFTQPQKACIQHVRWQVDAATAVCSSADCICGACYDFTCVTEQPETVMCLLRLTNGASTVGSRTRWVRAPGSRTAAPNFKSCRTVETISDESVLGHDLWPTTRST